jgi:hypothetical protein
MDLSKLKRLNSKDFGLNIHTKLFLDDDKIIYLIDRKSRIIKKDTEKIIKNINILKMNTDKNILLFIKTPTCSKSLDILNEKLSIQIIIEQLFFFFDKN